jgi:hypothetical protein
VDPIEGIDQTLRTAERLERRREGRIAETGADEIAPCLQRILAMRKLAMRSILGGESRHRRVLRPAHAPPSLCAETECGRKFGLCFDRSPARRRFGDLRLRLRRETGSGCHAPRPRLLAMLDALPRRGAIEWRVSRLGWLGRVLGMKRGSGIRTRLRRAHGNAKRCLTHLAEYRVFDHALDALDAGREADPLDAWAEQGPKMRPARRWARQAQLELRAQALSRQCHDLMLCRSSGSPRCRVLDARSRREALALDSGGTALGRLDRAHRLRECAGREIRRQLCVVQDPSCHAQGLATRRQLRDDPVDHLGACHAEGVHSCARTLKVMCQHHGIRELDGNADFGCRSQRLVEAA